MKEVFILLQEDSEDPWAKSIVSVHETYESASKILREKTERVLSYSIETHKVKP